MKKQILAGLAAGFLSFLSTAAMALPAGLSYTGDTVSYSNFSDSLGWYTGLTGTGNDVTLTLASPAARVQAGASLTNVVQFTLTMVPGVGLREMLYGSGVQMFEDGLDGSFLGNSQFQWSIDVFGNNGENRSDGSHFDFFSNTSFGFTSGHSPAFWPPGPDQPTEAVVRITQTITAGNGDNDYMQLRRGLELSPSVSGEPLPQEPTKVAEPGTLALLGFGLAGLGLLRRRR